MLPISFSNFSTIVLEHLDGGPKPEWFNETLGLCINYVEYLKYVGKDYRDDYHDLIDHFRVNYGTTAYPFGDIHVYSGEVTTNSLYKNEERLAFLRAHKL